MLIKVNKIGFNSDNMIHWEENESQLSLSFTNNSTITFWGKEAEALTCILKPQFFGVCNPNTRMIDAVSWYKEIMEINV